MKILHAFSFALLTAVAAYGCSTSDAGDDDTTHDDLAVRTGNIDHAGIVESTTMMLAFSPITFATVVDAYNEEDPFKINPGAYRQRYLDRIGMFDGEDQRTDWTPAQANAWATRMANGNYQVIDTSKPCDYSDPHTYLEIERAALTGAQHTTCGGRMPNEDALDVTINFLIRGPGGTARDERAVHDGVDQATKPSTATFPYLAEMNGI